MQYTTNRLGHKDIRRNIKADTECIEGYRVCYTANKGFESEMDTLAKSRRALSAKYNGFAIEPRPDMMRRNRWNPSQFKELSDDCIDHDTQRTMVGNR